MHFDSTLDDVWNDPDGTLRELRTMDPVHWSEIESSWVLTRHADAMRVLRDAQGFVSDPRRATGWARAQVEPVESHSPLSWDSLFSTTDGARHTDLRRAVGASFSPAAIDGLRPSVRERSRKFLKDSSSGVTDVIGHFMRPLARDTTLELIGVRSVDADHFSKLAESLTTAALSGSANPQLGTAEETLYEFSDLVARQPQIQPTLLASLQRSCASGALTQHDMISLLAFVASVGQAPTAFALGSGILALLRNPEQLQLLRSTPELVAHLTDEAARFAPPVRIIRRFAASDTQIEGQKIRAGDQMQLVVLATNRDPANFSDPNRFDLTRNSRDHLGFGWGSHHCIGAPLARAIAEEAVPLLLEAFPLMASAGELELLEGDPAGPMMLTLHGREGADLSSQEPETRSDAANRSVPTVPRNHACPCGSGRKYKRCHGRND